MTEELGRRGVTVVGLWKEGPGAGRSYPQGLDDQVSGFQLPLHHAEEHPELRFTEGVHVKLFFLQHTFKKKNDEKNYF